MRKCQWNESLAPLFLFIMAAMVGAVLLSSCASMEAYETQFCNYDRAFTKGYDDGSKGANNRIDQFAQCSSNADQAMKGYREGFEKGSAQLYGSSESKGPNENKPGGNGTTINIGVGGRDVTVGGSGDGSGARYAKTYYCELEAFTSRFESFGPTMLEARKNVIDQCTRKYNRMHCDGDDDIHCRKNL